MAGYFKSSARVAEYLGVVEDKRIQDCSDAAARWVENRRSMTDPADLWDEPDVLHGTVMLAALLYTQRAQPQGFAGLDDLGTFSEEVGMAMAQIYRLVGYDPVIA